MEGLYEGMKKLISNKKRYFPVICIIAAWLFIIFIYAPLELLFGNEYEFSYNMYDVLKYMLPVFFAVLLLLCLLFVSFSAFVKKIPVFFLPVLFTVLIATYIQGTFLSADLPPLDGRAISWNDYSSQRLWSILLWLAVGLSVLLLVKKIGSEKFGRISAFVSGFLVLMLGLSLLLTCFSTGGYRRNRQIVHSESYMLDMSEDENLVVFLLDAVDGEAFQHVLSLHPEYRDIFEDFTSFTNVSSAYPYTSRSIPFILSGEWYENEKPYGTYCQEAFSSSPLFAKMKENGYRMGLYDPEFSFVSGLDEMFENISIADHFHSIPDFVKMQILMSGYRYFPFDFKRLCYLTPDEIYTSSVKTAGLEAYCTVDNEDFSERLQQRSVVISDSPCFRFIYIRGAHEPFIYPSQSDGIPDNSYYSSVEFCMSVASEYLEKLKSAGVYENTAIVFLADHGYVENNLSFGRQNPFLLIKGRNETHPFEESDAPLSHDDLQLCFSRLLDGAASCESFDWNEEDTRNRRFLFFEYEGENVMWEYTVSGHASDESALVTTGNVYEFRS